MSCNWFLEKNPQFRVKTVNPEFVKKKQPEVTKNTKDTSFSQTEEDSDENNIARVTQKLRKNENYIINDTVVEKPSTALDEDNLQSFKRETIDRVYLKKLNLNKANIWTKLNLKDKEKYKKENDVCLLDPKKAYEKNQSLNGLVGQNVPIISESIYASLTDKNVLIGSKKLKGFRKKGINNDPTSPSKQSSHRPKTTNNRFDTQKVVSNNKQLSRRNSFSSNKDNSESKIYKKSRTKFKEDNMFSIGPTSGDKKNVILHRVMSIKGTPKNCNDQGTSNISATSPRDSTHENYQRSITRKQTGHFNPNLYKSALSQKTDQKNNYSEKDNKNTQSQAIISKFQKQSEKFTQFKTQDSADFSPKITKRSTFYQSHNQTFKGVLNLNNVTKHHSNTERYQPQKKSKFSSMKDPINNDIDFSSDFDKKLRYTERTAIQETMEGASEDSSVQESNEAVKLRNLNGPQILKPPEMVGKFIPKTKDSEIFYSQFEKNYCISRKKIHSNRNISHKANDSTEFTDRFMPLDTMGSKNNNAASFKNTGREVVSTYSLLPKGETFIVKKNTGVLSLIGNKYDSTVLNKYNTVSSGLEMSKEKLERTTTSKIAGNSSFKTQYNEAKKINVIPLTNKPNLYELKKPDKVYNKKGILKTGKTDKDNKNLINFISKVTINEKGLNIRGEQSFEDCDSDESLKSLEDLSEDQDTPKNIEQNYHDNFLNSVQKFVEDIDNKNKILYKNKHNRPDTLHDKYEKIFQRIEHLSNKYILKVPKKFEGTLKEVQSEEKFEYYADRFRDSLISNKAKVTELVPKRTTNHSGHNHLHSHKHSEKAELFKKIVDLDFKSVEAERQKFVHILNNPYNSLWIWERTNQSESINKGMALKRLNKNILDNLNNNKMRDGFIHFKLEECVKKFLLANRKATDIYDKDFLQYSDEHEKKFLDEWQPLINLIPKDPEKGYQINWKKGMVDRIGGQHKNVYADYNLHSKTLKQYEATRETKDKVKKGVEKLHQTYYEMKEIQELEISRMVRNRYEPVYFAKQFHKYFNTSILETYDQSNLPSKKYLMKQKEHDNHFQNSDNRKQQKILMKILIKESSEQTPQLMSIQYDSKFEQDKKNSKYEKRKLQLTRFKANLKLLVNLDLTIDDFDELKLVISTPNIRPLTKQFHNAVKKGEIWAASQLIKKDPFVIHSINHQCHNAVHFACKKNDINMLEFLIKNKANLWAVDHFNQNSLHFAALNDNSHMLIQLLENRLDPYTLFKSQMEVVDASYEFKNIVAQTKKLYFAQAFANRDHRKYEFKKKMQDIKRNYTDGIASCDFKQGLISDNYFEKKHVIEKLEKVTHRD